MNSKPAITGDALRASVEETAGRLAGRPRPAVATLRSEPEISFEFFPPATTGDEHFRATLEALDPLGADFMSVTYGAGGSSQERTLAALQAINSRCQTPAMGHLTCIGASRDSVLEVVDSYAAAGINRILALRGDPPAGTTEFAAHADGFDGAVDLVAAIAGRGDFDLSVAAYPEKHPQARSAAADLDHLKRKLDAGARRAITQFFFEPDTFLSFRDRAAAAGISAPIIPGILPVMTLPRTLAMARQCGTTVPAWLGQLFQGLDDAPQIRQLVAATVTAELCTRLQDQGVHQFHFYTLNRPELTWSICHILGLRAAGSGNVAANLNQRIPAA